MNRLKELRKEKKLTQEELVKKIGVSKITVLRWENEERQVKPDKAQELADYFGVSVGYLLGYDSPSMHIKPIISKTEIKMMSEFLVQTGQSEEYRQGVKDLEGLILARLEENFSDFYSPVFGKELDHED